MGAERDPHRRLQLLEGRRIAHEASQWQAPALMVAGQAFLLQILTDPGVDWSVAVAAAAAGMIASVAAIFSLAQLRYSERRHSEAVAALADDAGVGGDPRRDALELEQGKHRRWLIGGPVAAY